MTINLDLYRWFRRMLRAKGRLPYRPLLTLFYFRISVRYPHFSIILPCCLFGFDWSADDFMTRRHSDGLGFFHVGLLPHVPYREGEFIWWKSWSFAHRPVDHQTWLERQTT